MNDKNKDKVKENTPMVGDFYAMVMKIFEPSYLKAEEEIDRIRINPAKQSDSKAIKNGAD